MNKVVQKAIMMARRPVFGRAEAALWSGREGAALDALLKRAVKNQDIIRYRRGLYGLSPRYLHEPLQPFALAQYLDGPSYISLESALSYYGWIPEAVYTVTSVSMNRSKSFDTPAGLFSFTGISQRTFFAGVNVGQTTSGGQFMVASPLKALADYCYVHRLKWQSVSFLLDSLRLEEEELKTLHVRDFDALNGVYPQRRVIEFLAGLRKELSR